MPVTPDNQITEEQIMNTRKKISLAVVGTLCCVQLGGVALAEEAKPTASVAVSALSKYVWRGFEYSKESVVLQPSMTVAYKGFSANLWGNEDTHVYIDGAEGADSNNWTETDLTLAYDWTMGPVGLTAGYIYYGLIGLDSQELFAKAALHTLLTPTLTVYRDYDHYAGWYATLGVSHTMPITEKIGLSLGAQVGYLAADDDSSYAKYNGVGNPTSEACNDFHDGLLTASIAIPVNQYVTITPGLNYSFPLTSHSSDLIESNSQEFLNGNTRGDHNFIYGGVTVSMAF
jgi:hypothetical protein